jgi:predicted HTH transcriptional regulator
MKPGILKNASMESRPWIPLATGLETQMIEVKERGEQVIRRDVLVQKYGLNERQGKVLAFLLEHNQMTIQDYEGLCPDVNRLSLQRDLKGMQDKELVISEGATNQLVYVLRV